MFVAVLRPPPENIRIRGRVDLQGNGQVIHFAQTPFASLPGIGLAIKQQVLRVGPGQPPSVARRFSAHLQPKLHG